MQHFDLYKNEELLLTQSGEMAPLVTHEHGDNHFPIQQTSFSDLSNDSINTIMSYLPYRNWDEVNNEGDNDSDKFKGGLASFRLTNKRMDQETEQTDRGKKARAAHFIEPHWIRSNAADFYESSDKYFLYVPTKPGIACYAGSTFTGLATAIASCMTSGNISSVILHASCVPNTVSVAVMCASYGLFANANSIKKSREEIQSIRDEIDASHRL